MVCRYHSDVGNDLLYCFSYCFILFFRFVNAFVYHGLSQNTNELAGNPFVNFALYGVMEIPAFLIAIFTVQKLGKRNLIGGSMIIVGVTFCVCDLLPSGKYV